MVELIVFQSFEVRLVFKHLIKETFVFGVSVDDEQDYEENIKKKGVDGADQCLVVCWFYEDHVSTDKQ